MEKIVIIGNSVAGIAAIQAIRETDKGSEVVVISKEPHLAYSRPLISYLLEGKVTEEKMYYRDKEFYQKNNIKLMLNSEVVGINPEKNTVTLEDKKDITYTKLLIAAGGKPIMPPIKGLDSGNVFTFTAWDDVSRLSQVLKKKNAGIKKAVVIGAGMIGLKAAESLSKSGLKVAIVELADRPLSSVLDKDAASILHRHLKENGVELILKTTVSKINTKNKRITGVTLSNRKKIDAGLLVAAIGVVPNLDFLKNSAIKTGRGIIVDNKMQTNIKNIYAAGDVAQAYDFLYNCNRPIPVWPLAYEQGEVAGSQMAGGNKTYKGGLNLNSIEVFGLPLISAGISVPDEKQVKEQELETIIKSFPEKKSYKKIILRDNRIIGLIFINDIDRAGIVTNIIRDQLDASSFRDDILEESFGYIYVPKEFRSKRVAPLEV